MHSEKNKGQHRTFLDEYPIGAPETHKALAWMRSLPSLLEKEDFRAVHACWIDSSIARLREIAPDGVLTEEQLIRAADPDDMLIGLAEQITKGPEHRLPESFAFPDKDGTHRDHVRLQWWNTGARIWRDIAIPVPDPDALPDASLPDLLRAQACPANERPVFFGHYWLNGAPCLQGKDGPLVTYEFQREEGPLSLDRIRVHPLPA